MYKGYNYIWLTQERVKSSLIISFQVWINEEIGKMYWLLINKESVKQ